MLVIAADTNIPLVAEACDGFGAVQLFRASDHGGLQRAVASADILLCRSTVRVDSALLAHSPIRFVATATSGFDHLDIEWLSSRGIRSYAAHGCNARSVAEYVWIALYHVSATKGIRLSDLSIGIIGAGQVGSRVEEIARRLGLRCVLNDPPLAERTGNPRYRSLDEALDCDIVSLHVPLTDQGRHPTRHMIDASAFARIRRGATFINTSRGAVVDALALAESARSGRFTAVILDVFENEPDIEPSILDIADIATPHIAGHSLDGKLEGTRMVHAALSAFLGRDASWHYSGHVPMRLFLQNCGGSATGLPLAVSILNEAYDITADDGAFREAMKVTREKRAAAFSALRENYPVRREFHRYSLRQPDVSADVRLLLDAVGIDCRADAPASGEDINP